MKPLRLLTAVALLFAANSSAFAGETVFPPGARVGLTPLVGLVPAKAFAGFESEDHGVKVLVTELPAEAYGEVANAFKANPAGTNGINPSCSSTGTSLRIATDANICRMASSV